MLLFALPTLFSALRSHRELALENLALRHQLDVLKRNTKRPRLKNKDRLLWIMLAQFWSHWRKPLILFKPETVIRWHKKGFRLYWRWKSRGGGPGRRPVPKHIRDLIRMMSRNNPIWGAPRIHGELLKLGIEISQGTVFKYMVRHRKSAPQSWRTFLKNHAKDIVSVDFFTVPTATFRVLYVFIILSNARRRIVHFNVTDSPTASWIGQQIVEAFPWDTADPVEICGWVEDSGKSVSPAHQLKWRKEIKKDILLSGLLGGVVIFVWIIVSSTIIPVSGNIGKEIPDDRDIHTCQFRPSGVSISGRMGFMKGTRVRQARMSLKTAAYEGTPATLFLGVLCQPECGGFSALIVWLPKRKPLRNHSTFLAQPETWLGGVGAIFSAAVLSAEGSTPVATALPVGGAAAVGTPRVGTLVANLSNTRNDNML